MKLSPLRVRLATTYTIAPTMPAAVVIPSVTASVISQTGQANLWRVAEVDCSARLTHWSQHDGQYPAPWGLIPPGLLIRAASVEHSSGLPRAQRGSF
jgi:hypothetical protein